MKAVVELSNAAIYQNEHLVLNRVNLTIREGEFCYLIGKTGSGKSSLLKTIYAALPLEEGEGAVAGFNLKNLPWKDIPYLRRKLGIVFQDFNLLMDRTVDENLKFVLRATGWEDPHQMDLRMADVLDSVGLKTKGFKMPHELSGGEQQRVVMARALLNKPRIILADEPTGNLDPETSDDLVKLLIELSQNNKTAVLLATHDYTILEKFPSRIIRCQSGRVIDEENFVL